jgi:hypothetical protein
MKLRDIRLDGGSLMIGCIIVVTIATGLIDHWGRANVQTVVAVVGICVAVALLFLWQSVRIGHNRQRQRDVRRWMGERSDESTK